MEQLLAAIGSGLLYTAAILLILSALLGLWPLVAAVRKPSESARAPLAGKRGAGSLWLHAAAWVLVTAAMGLLIGLFLADAFAFEYVAGRSSRALAPVYKVTALWAGQEGSLLLWLWLQAGFGLIVAIKARRGRWLDRGAAAILAAISAFFAVLVAWVLAPFALRLPAPADGAGLNPILQSYWMTSHPVMLYLGYVGFSVPFAYALSSLVTGEAAWIRTTRRWSLVAWTFLSVGILYGARWAYEVLGWGGYWGWDPVENASFMPWLVATAFIHSGIIEEKRGMLRRWNHALVLVTYLLTIFGTFITRSGILSSVHAFVESDISPWFIGYMGVFLAVFLYALIARWPQLADERPIVSPLSKESSFLANNVVMLAASFAIFWGTVFPLVAALFGRQVTVGTPYFNRVSGPLFWAMIILMGVAPLIAWRRASADNLKRQFTLPLVNGLFMAVWLWVVGARETVVLLSLPAVMFVATTIAMEFARGVRVRRKSRGEPAWLALIRLMNRSPGRYGGYVVHLGVLLVAVGIVLSQTYQVETNAVLQVGEQVAIGPYTVSLFEIEEAMHGDVPAVEATVLVRDRANRPLGFLTPSKRFYPGSMSQEPMTQVAIYGTWMGDLYAVLAGWEPFGTYVGFKFYYNPAVWLIWAGGGLLVFGAVFALWPRAKAAQATQEERALAALAELELDYQAGKVTEVEYQALYAELSPKARRLLEREKAAQQRVLEELRALLEGSALGLGEKRPGAMAEKKAGGEVGLVALLLAVGLAAGLVGGGSALAAALPGQEAMDEGLVIPRETLVLRWQDGRLWVLDLVTATNAGSETLSEVRLPLAQGAAGVSVEGGELEVADGAVWDRAPVSPGETRRYTLQYYVIPFRWPYPLQREIVYPTAELLVMAMPGELAVGGLDLEQGPPQEIAGQTLDVWMSRWLPAGTLWQATVRPGAHAGPVAGWNPAVLELPVLAALDRFPGDWLIQRAARNPKGALGALALLFLAALGALFSLKKEREKARGNRALKEGAEGQPGASQSRVSRPLETVEALVREIARLDVASQDGALSRRTYARRRRRLVERLVSEARALEPELLERLFQR